MMEMTVLGNRISVITDGAKVSPFGSKMDMGDYFVQNGKLRKARGLGWILAALFVVADMAGGGIVALPTAVVRCQFYPGLLILLFMALISTTSAIMLGQCWEILIRRFPAYRTHCRKPYAEIGLKALGEKMRTIVSICVNITQYGATTVFLLLCAKNIRDFIRAFLNVEISFCYLIVMIALVLLPVTLLKSPNDFWPVIVGGMISTIVAIVFICIGSMMDWESCASAKELPSFDFSNYLSALGTMLFTYGGHSAFPTIQHDMKKPSEFNKSAILGFFLISVFNFTTVLVCGTVYGNSIRESVINSIQTVWIQQAINIMITAHCLLTVTLLINPLNQEMEELFSVPHDFGWKRVILRTSVLAIIVLTAETVPSFGPVLDFFGGSTVALTSVVFPSLFYLYLAAGELKSKEPAHLGNNEPTTFKEMVERTNWKSLVLCGTIIVLSSVAGIIATLSALKALTTTHFVTPCYVHFLFPDDENATAITSTNCCGPFQNISRYHSDGYCTTPDLTFY
uniref:Amino acid transporter transmembrane domain-containing protein n=1 Tax=Globodera rostochiensis TaxID=31243 RepID=A0A914HP62_GLORO